MIYTPYKIQHSLNVRKAESRRIVEKYPDRIPVICERETKTNDKIPQISKNKYLVPHDLTVGQFMAVIRNRLVLDPGVALYFITEDGSIPSQSKTFVDLYEEYKNIDGFLYIKYSGENTFG